MEFTLLLILVSIYAISLFIGLFKQEGIATYVLYLGFILLSLSLLSVLVWFIIIIFYYMISRYEERLLTQRFGSVYEEYKKKVPMLFPIKSPY